MTNKQQHRISLSIVLTITVFCLGSRVIAQQQPTQPADQGDVIRVKTDLVQLRAVVTDKSGKLVANLNQDDFEVLENGKPQTVSFFSLERIPDGKAGPPAADPARPPAGDRPSGSTAANAKPVRTIVLLVDTLHLNSISLLRAKQQLKRFVDEQVTDQDVVAIVTTSGSLGVLQQFMRDRQRLKSAIDRISGFPRPTSFYTPYLAAMVMKDAYGALGTATSIMAAEDRMVFAPTEGMVRGRAQDILGREEQMRRSTWQIVKAVSEQMAEMPGQRMIGFVSDGFTRRDSGGGADNMDFTAATSRAVRSGVVIYCFSPQGLTAPSEFSAQAPVGSPDFGRYMSESLMDQQDTLRDLAANTGGEAYLNSNDVVGQFKKMLDVNSTYYALGYYPQNVADKKFRNLKVVVKNHPEYKIRTQKGYQPSVEKAEEVAKTPQQKLFKAMIAPLPLTTISVTTAANFLAIADDDAQVALQVHFAGDLLQYPKQDQKYSLNCQIVVAIFDKAAKMLPTQAETIHTTLTAEQMELAKQNGYRYGKRISLVPGLYQVRVGVRDVNGDLMGTSMAWVEVPDLANKKLALSNIFIGKEQKKQEHPQLASKRDTQPKSTLVVGTASFNKGEPVYYRFVVYNAQIEGRSTADLQLQVEIMQGETSIFKGDWQPLAPRIIREDKKGVEVGGQLKLGLDAGLYTLRVNVKDAKSKKATQQTTDLELAQ